MNKIEVSLLNPAAITDAERMMVCAARLTQRGHKVKSVFDFKDLFEKPYSVQTAESMVNLPHPTIQKFAAINVVVVGASRRVLSQLTRHQNEVKFMSASLQYSDYSRAAQFVVPYNILGTEYETLYIQNCENQLETYERLVEAGIDNDEAGYLMPQSLRNVLIISATPYQWRHMISQRVCRRNTLETRYVMLKIWERLKDVNDILFKDCGPFCYGGPCKEGKMSCGNPMTGLDPSEILKRDFSKICV